MTSEKVYIIAEAGVNHNGSLDMALQLIDAAASAGADAVKFQTFNADELVTSDAEQADYQQKNVGKNQSQHALLKKLELPLDDFRTLQKFAISKNITFLSTPFDKVSAEFLIYDLHVPLLKIPSGEVTNLLFLRYLAQSKLPLIMSTGMSDMQEIEKAVSTILGVNENCDLTLLHCTTSYPCPLAEVNLRAMNTLGTKFNCKIGYSDHTMGIEVPIAAVALGAKVIEKHFTLDRKMEGPDHAASLEPLELKAMVEGIRNIETALGSAEKKPTDKERMISNVVRKNIVSMRDLPVGYILKEEDLSAKRSTTGISANYIDEVIGRKIAKEKRVNDVLQWEDLV